MKNAKRKVERNVERNVARNVARGVARLACMCAFACTTLMVVNPSVAAQRLVPVGLASATEGRAKPDLEPARVIGEVLAGAYAGIGGYVIASWASGFLTDRLTDASDGTKDQIQFGFGVAGAVASTAVSVWAVGDIGDQTGSYSATVIGAAGGVATAFLINKALYGSTRLPTEHGSSRMRWVEASLEALLPSIGATIGFNSSRRYK